MFVVQWRGGMAFEALPPSGAKFLMDASLDSGGGGQGPTPVEAFLASAAGCSAMDVIAILQKMRQDVQEYWVEIEWVRGPEGVFPRPVTEVTLTHHVRGEDIDPDAVAKAVELSDVKYCTVIATLRTAPKVTSRFHVE